MNTAKYESIKNEMLAGVNLIRGDEYKYQLIAICDIAADIVKQTLGPYACTTTLDDGMSTYPTKDGWSVLDRLLFADGLQQTLYNHIKKISFALNSRVGDGTTTALVVADHFIKNFTKAIDHLIESGGNKFRQADIVDMIEECKNEIIKRLKLRAAHIRREKDGYDKIYPDIYNIAYISSNRNEEISEIIRNIYEETDNPNIHVTLSDTEVTHYTINRGYKIDAHVLWHQFYLGSESEYVLGNGANVIVFDHMIKYNEHYNLINNILAKGRQDQTSTVILAPGYDDLFISAFGGSIKEIVKTGNIPSVVLVQLSLTNQALRNYATDFAVLANAEMFNYTKVRMYNFLERYAKGEDLSDNAEFQDLFNNETYRSPEKLIELCTGKAVRMVISEKYVMLEDFSKDTIMYKAALEEITKAYEAARDTVSQGGEVLSKEYMDTHIRLVKFLGNAGTIFVGGDSDLKKKCLRDAVLDATLACRSAFENGYIRGFNTETLTVIREIISEYYPVSDTKDSIMRVLYQMMYDTFAQTSLDVMKNKTDDPNYVWGDTENIDAESLEYRASCIFEKCCKTNQCYNIVEEKFEPFGKSVVNSVATDIEILNAATSIITMLLTSNQMLSINKRYDRHASRMEALQDRHDECEAMTKGFLDAVSASPEIIANITGVIHDTKTASIEDLK